MLRNAQEDSPTTVCHLFTAPKYSISPLQQDTDAKLSNDTATNDAHHVANNFIPNSGSACTQAGPWPGRRRLQLKSKCRASVFRCFLIDTFGRELLRQGVGVLDVAGGQGELAFELLNLNGIPATVLEPRLLDLQKRCKRLLAGSYLSSSVSSSGSVCHWHKQGDAGQCLTVPAASIGPLLPDHLRMTVTPALAACLSASSSGSGCSVAGHAVEDLRDLGLEEQAEASSSMPIGWPTAFHHAQQQAQLSKWSKLGTFHEPGSAVQQSNEQDEAQGCSTGLSGQASGPAEAVSRATPPPLDKLAAPMRRKAVAWSISVDTDSDSDGEDHLRSRPSTMPANSTLAVSASNHLLDLSQQQAPAVTDAAAAWQRFTACSIVVGIHPDQATDFIVDFAIAQGKPFAVVPCCVHSREFPRRMLGGRLVTTYEQLLQYLVAKDPARIRIITLPFQGRNKVLYRVV